MYDVKLFKSSFSIEMGGWKIIDGLCIQIFHVKLAPEALARMSLKGY